MLVEGDLSLCWNTVLAKFQLSNSCPIYLICLIVYLMSSYGVVYEYS